MYSSFVSLKSLLIRHKIRDIGCSLSYHCITPYLSSNLNLSQVNKGLQLGWVGFKNETYFEQVNALEPGNSMVVTAEGIVQKKPYWEIQPGKNVSENTLVTRRAPLKTFSKLQGASSVCVELSQE